MDLIVYGEFGGPESYLASRRVDALAAAAVRIDWRAVGTAGDLPVGGCRLSAAELEARSQRVLALERLLLPGESVRWHQPTLVPNSDAAVSAFAEAHGTRTEGDVRRLLFELYWRDGVDIGSPNALRGPLAGPMLRAGAGPDSMRQVGYAVSVDRAPITTGAFLRVRAWRAEWEALGRPSLPVVLVGGATLTGLDALRRLGKEIAYVGADPDPELPDPRRYPAVEGRSSPAWVSQIGGRWRNVYRLAPTR